MSESAHEDHGIDLRTLDRLVDGELGEFERRRLLAQLDAEPDGWRRCAEAFLEAQIWRSELRAMAQELAPASVSVNSASAALGRRQCVPGPRSALALAATFLVAFSLGCLIRNGPGWIFHGSRPNNPLVNASRRATDGVFSSADQPSSESVPNLPKPPVRTVGMLSWMIEGEGEVRQIAVPVVMGPGIDEQWLLSQQPDIEAPVLRDLERRGHKVVADRHLVAFALTDGRRVIVPWDTVEVHFAGRVYQ
jgi:hypothetical protein